MREYFWPHTVGQIQTNIQENWSNNSFISFLCIPAILTLLLFLFER